MGADSDLMLDCDSSRKLTRWMLMWNMLRSGKDNNSVIIVKKT